MVSHGRDLDFHARVHSSYEEGSRTSGLTIRADGDAIMQDLLAPGVTKCPAVNRQKTVRLKLRLDLNSRGGGRRQKLNRVIQAQST